MADGDYNRRDDYDRPDDRYDDRRPSRRYDGEPPKKGRGLMIVLIILGSLTVVCGGGCGIGGYLYVKWIMDIMQKPEDFLSKVRAGDYQGAYNSTSSSYKARYTLQQFTDAMKGAKLDKNTGLAAPLASQSGGGKRSQTLIATVGLSDGTTTDVTFDLVQDKGPFDFVIGDVTGPDISYTGKPALKPVGPPGGMGR